MWTLEAYCQPIGVDYLLGIPMDLSHVSICQHQFHQHYALIGIPVEKCLFTVYSRSIPDTYDLFQKINRYRYNAVCCLATMTPQRNRNFPSRLGDILCILLGWELDILCSCNFTTTTHNSQLLLCLVQIAQKVAQAVMKQKFVCCGKS